MAYHLYAYRQILEFDLPVLLGNTLEMQFFTAVFYLSLKTANAHAYSTVICLSAATC